MNVTQMHFHRKPNRFGSPKNSLNKMKLLGINAYEAVRGDISRKFSLFLSISFLLHLENWKEGFAGALDWRYGELRD